MRSFPIIPVWLMLVLSIVYLLFVVDFKHINKYIVDILIVIVVFIINLRFMFPSGEALIVSNSLDVFFVVDNTISMEALDYNGNNTRLSGVKNDLKYIVNKLNGAKFSLITFNNKVNTVTPLTRDNNMTIEAIDIISTIDELYAKGSSLNTPKKEVLNALSQSNKKGDRQRILFFISDGEITDDSKLESYSKLRKYVKNGAVLGYGTTNGGNMLQYDKYTDKYDYIMDYQSMNYGKAVSKIDEKNLKSIASDIGIDYIYMDKQSNLDSKLSEISRLSTASFESTDKKAYDDVYYIFTVPLLILLLIKFRKIKGELQ